MSKRIKARKSQLGAYEAQSLEQQMLLNKASKVETLLGILPEVVLEDLQTKLQEAFSWKELPDLGERGKVDKTFSRSAREKMDSILEQRSRMNGLVKAHHEERKNALSRAAQERLIEAENCLKAAQEEEKASWYRLRQEVKAKAAAEKLQQELEKAAKEEAALKLWKELTADC